MEEEAQRLEEHSHRRTRDLEARLSSAEKELEQLGSELGASRAQVMELKEGRNAAFVVAA